MEFAAPIGLLITVNVYVDVNPVGLNALIQNGTELLREYVNEEALNEQGASISISRGREGL